MRGESTMSCSASKCDEDYCGVNKPFERRQWSAIRCAPRIGRPNIKTGKCASVGKRICELEDLRKCLKVCEFAEGLRLWGSSVTIGKAFLTLTYRKIRKRCLRIGESSVSTSLTLLHQIILAPRLALVCIYTMQIEKHA